MINQKQMRYLFIVWMTLMLSACLSPATIPPESSYIVDSSPSVRQKARHSPVTIMVQLAQTYPAFNSTKMAYSEEPYQISYYAVNRWAANPAHMLTPLIVRTLQNSNRYKAIMTAPFSGHYNYLLSSEILDFKQDFTGHRPVFDLRIRFQLVNMTNYEVTGTKDVHVRQPMGQVSPLSGVYAANQAVKNALLQLTYFLDKKVH